MTAKEKAKELYNKFLDIEYTRLSGNKVASININQAKQCALIAVDEILNHHYQQDGLYKIDRYYFQQVKTELEKL
jgi:hypothetical protein